MSGERIDSTQHPTVATVLATRPTLRTPCVYCGAEYRSAPCGAVHAGVRRALAAPSDTEGR
jgi:hypothetical protein